jgi:death-on-curing protein
MRRIRYRELAVIAAAVLQTTPKAICGLPNRSIAESALSAPFAGFHNTDHYPALPHKAAVLCSRLVRNHPFPDGNKRIAYLAMIELIERNGGTFDDRDQDHIADTIEALAAREVSEDDFILWVTGRTRLPNDSSAVQRSFED